MGDKAKPSRFGRLLRRMEERRQGRDLEAVWNLIADLVIVTDEVRSDLRTYLRRVEEIEARLADLEITLAARRTGAA